MIAVIADDITGANDIGSMFAKNQLKTDVLFDSGYLEHYQKSESEVLIVDTDSRFDKPEDAYQKVFETTKAMESLGATKYFNKTCSVFRGNIGAEFDAMLEALQEEFAVIILGFPKNGRETINGVHYVHGKELSQSEFRNDPLHPMRTSNLAEILRSQTERKVGLVNYETVRTGTVKLKNELIRQKEFYQYVIVDVIDQQDLKIIAEAVKDFRILCGSSAIAEGLPHFLEKTDDTLPLPLPEKSEGGILMVAGSLMPQSKKQIEYMHNKADVIQLEALQLLEKAERDEMIIELTKLISMIIKNNQHVLLHSPNNADEVREMKSRARRKGMSNPEVSRLVSESLAEIAKNVLECTGQNKLLVAGGDTSAAVCKKLQIKAMRVYKEIQPGLPSCVTLGDRPLHIVLKSGSFGSEDFFMEAIKYLSGE